MARSGEKRAAEWRRVSGETAATAVAQAGSVKYHERRRGEINVKQMKRNMRKHGMVRVAAKLKIINNQLEKKMKAQ